MQAAPTPTWRHPTPRMMFQRRCLTTSLPSPSAPTCSATSAPRTASRPPSTTSSPRLRASTTSSTSTPPFHCVTSSDCQLNGACKASTGKCICDAGWVGEQCHSLDLLPTPLGSGLQDPVLSSWGGSVLQNATDGSWHMYVEEREKERERGIHTRMLPCVCRCEGVRQRHPHEE